MLGDHCGWERGYITYRNLLSNHNTAFQTCVVGIDELADCLPPDTATVSPQQRVEQMLARLRGVRQRYQQ